MLMGLCLGVGFFLNGSRDARVVRVSHPGRPLVTRGLLLFLILLLLRFLLLSLLDFLVSSLFCGTAAAPLSLFHRRFHRGGEPGSGSSAPVSDNNLSDLKSSSDSASRLLLVTLFYIPKNETDRFDGKSNFVMWRRKMKAVLVQNKIAPTICSPKELTGENLLVIVLKAVPNHEKSKVKCFYCGKEGHMKNKCFKRINDDNQRKHGKGGNKVDKTHVFESDGNSMFSEVLCVYLSLSCTDVVNHWVLDSGCSLHMTPNKH
ncbi:hypothetical protein M9H77_11480 [Catharanthus roseus]|uniref:Uncharacterized protein n=1 Tax=Catharanthus roseus TaxID=4058 RepID=A0ACC0BEN3_CATRO|nr:hypothetical protein M9H77_11480 [Catharanthus roseus]